MVRTAVRALLPVLVVLLVAGLVVCGAPHHALHADGNPGSGIHCDGCMVSGTVPVTSIPIVGPILSLQARRDAIPVSAPAPAPLVLHSPRGPPDVA